MNIHEFQAKQILAKYGIPIPEYHLVSSLKDVEEVLHSTGWKSAVIKVQVHAGGRGKAGGVKIGRTPAEILEASHELLGKKIINEQTGPDGLISHQLILSPLVSILQEYYLGLTISRDKAAIVLIASPVGGIDIEKVAHEQPDQVLFLNLPLEGTFRSYQLARICKLMGWEGDLKLQGIQMLQALTRAFIEQDATLLEINPLVKTEEGQLVALDAKLVVDENALFRQPLLKNMFDPTQVHPDEARAQEFELAYVSLDGDIGCMVNGAGLAMSTMDIIDHFGGKAANFLDVGGSATKEKVAEGFKIILSDSNVKAILINIFGGIMDCETLAKGIIEAAKELHIHLPLVVRMEGTNVEKGKQLLDESKLNIVIAANLTEAAQKVVSMTRKAGD